MEYAGLIVGLGNPGHQYQGTRHNMGFDALDALLKDAARSGTVETLAGRRFACELFRCTLPGEQRWWLAAKPQTFMNLSGESVRPLLAWHKLSPDKLLVLHDELDLPPGRLRFKFGGGNAGHNGLKSITQQLGSPDFYRLRLGVGRPPVKGGDVSGWVLSRPDPAAASLCRQSIEAAVTTIHIFVSKGLKEATACANSFSPEASPKERS